MYIIPILIVTALIALDQLSKYIVLVYLKPIEQIRLISGVFHLTYLENSGAAFGMLQGARWLFVLLTVLILGGLVYYYTRLPKGRVYSWIRFSLILICAGAVGNFIDRLINGYVIDFLYFALIDFPIFNLADVFVVCGTILLGVLLLFFVKDTSQPKTKQAETEANDSETQI